MSDSVQALTPAPIVRRLADGSQYTFSPITPADWSRFCVWMNQRQGERPNRLVGLEEMTNAAQTVDGMLQLAWQSASRNHKGLRKAEIEEKLTMGDLAQIIPSLMDLPESEGEPSSDPPESTGSGSP